MYSLIVLRLILCLAYVASFFGLFVRNKYFEIPFCLVFIKEKFDYLIGIVRFVIQATISFLRSLEMLGILVRLYGRVLKNLVLDERLK